MALAKVRSAATENAPLGPPLTPQLCGRGSGQLTSEFVLRLAPAQDIVQLCMPNARGLVRREGQCNLVQELPSSIHDVMEINALGVEHLDVFLCEV
eukprot:CAMPEP_0170639918 /NCGR_PEP_ID=MMETSP0224-20130122/39919_1 /TAXON_ID=285029 /ORGANISM="Togula jolla, Strain CCCM 725" /LENGTH=95 /DNA_ID=CAMNT_0010970333 /DNA_START=38 /DNA_END=325 /DNA_ORIENTATION=+